MRAKAAGHALKPEGRWLKDVRPFHSMKCGARESNIDLMEVNRGKNILACRISAA